MLDTNFVLVLHGGIEIPVFWPMRIGREYDPGKREWNIDVWGSKAEIPAARNPRFIIGKWGTGYGNMDGVVRTVPFDAVIATKALSPEDSARAVRARKRARKTWKKRQRIRRGEDHMPEVTPELIAELRQICDKCAVLRRDHGSLVKLTYARDALHTAAEQHLPALLDALEQAQSDLAEAKQTRQDALEYGARMEARNERLATERDALLAEHEEVGRYLGEGYFEPLNQAHATAARVLAGKEPKE